MTIQEVACRHIGLLDYLFLAQVRFQVKLLRKSVDDSRWSAALATGLWFGWLILLMLCCVGLIKRNVLTTYIIDNIYISILVLVLCTLFVIVRYFRFIKYNDLDKWRQNMNSTRRGFMHLCYLIMLVSIPIALFITMRLYLYDQIAW